MKEAIIIQGYDDIEIISNETIIFKASRKSNWLGKITTQINYNEKDYITATKGGMFLNKFKILINNSERDLNFSNETEKMIIDNQIMERKYCDFFGLHFYIKLNSQKICDVKMIDKFKFLAKVKYKVDFIKEDPINLFALIYICITEKTLFS